VGLIGVWLPRLRFAPFQLAWWQQRDRQPLAAPKADWIALQVTILIVLVCGAVSIGWLVRAGLERHSMGSHMALFSILLITVAFVGVAIACWTSLLQIAAITEAREEVERTLRDLQQTQTQLVQAEKMSSLGQLVAGIAHEINNPVNFIYGNLTHVREYSQDLLRLIQLYEKHYPNPAPAIQAEADAVDLGFLQDDLIKTLDSMKIGTDRIRQIVLSLRNFSRMDEAEFKAVNIHEGIDSTLLILQHRLKARSDRPEIQLTKNYGVLPQVECYPGPLNQVLMNILANAIDALEERSANPTDQAIDAKRNEITVRTSVLKDQWIEIAIADNGPGMSETVQQRIFNPFFTTKPVGKGTGMGMSISHQIITEKHGGMLKCKSSLGAGTEFVIQIPVRQPLSESAV
jgi:signal transduction histidine kinase